MKNLLQYFKHIVKDPINTIEEADARKKEIMPLLYISAGVLAFGLILQVITELELMATFSFIGLVGVIFCAFLFSVISGAKQRFLGLTCNKCHTMAEIKTPEAFAKYVSYTVEKDVAVFGKYIGSKEPSNGVYSLVKFTASSEAIVSVEITCPHCGEVKQLKYSANPFKCQAEKQKISVSQFPVVKASLENSVMAAVADYNDPEKRQNVPYSIHSQKNPNFENRTNPQFVRGNAWPKYNGVEITYHKDIEEMLEHYFVLNELNGELYDPSNPPKRKLFKFF